jgi:hypothetical protein
MFIIMGCLASDFLHYSCALALDAGAVVLADFDIYLFVRFIVLRSFSRGRDLPCAGAGTAVGRATAKTAMDRTVAMTAVNFILIEVESVRGVW